MATAYGIAVTGTMVVTCCLAYVVTRRRWGWSLAASLAVIVPFLTIDLIFFGANILRITQGGWMPLTLAAGILLIIWTWRRGRKLVSRLEDEGSVPLAEFAAALAARTPARVEGTTVYLTARNEETPDVREDLVRAAGRITGAARASFFIGRNNFAFSDDSGMPMWQDVLFIALYRNAADPTDYFNIPPNRVIELGAHYAI